MRTKTVKVREGELLGPIDWGYNFRKHFDTYSSTDEARHERCDKAIHLLREVERLGDKARITTYGCFDYDVYQVGMYDGWPFWAPTPAVLRSGPLGPEWTFFYDITAVKERLR